MKQTQRQQQEQHAQDDAITELRSRTYQAHDLILLNDAILLIAYLVQPRNETMGETLQRIRQMVRIAQAPKNGRLRLTPDDDGRLKFGDLMAWVYSKKKLRALMRDGASVFDGLPGFHGTASGALTLPVPQMTGYGYSTPPADAERDRALEEANLQIMDLMQQVAALQVENKLMRPDWLKAEDRRRKNKASAQAPRPRNKMKE